MNSESKSIDDFRALVQRTVPTIRARGGIIVGAALGNLLRQEAPEFRVSDFGATRLVDLLDRIPEIGSVMRSTGPDIQFLLTGTSGEASSTPQWRSNEEPTERLVSPLWNSLVAFVPKHRAFADLALGRMVYCPVDEQPDEIDDDPARFVEVPPIGQESMKAWAVEFASESLEGDAAEHIGRLEAAVWFPSFIRMLSPGDRDRWLSVHVRQVVEWWKAWANERGIDPRRGMVPVSPQPPRRTRATSDAEGSITEIEGLRSMLHRAIDEMGLDELLSLRVPVRYVWRGGHRN